MWCGHGAAGTTVLFCSGVQTVSFSTGKESPFHRGKTTGAKAKNEWSIPPLPADTFMV